MLLLFQHLGISLVFKLFKDLKSLLEDLNLTFTFPHCCVPVSSICIFCTRLLRSCKRCNMLCFVRSMPCLNWSLRVFCSEGVLTDSEEDKGPEAVAQQNAPSVWSSKQATEQGSYSSEASSERGETAHLCCSAAWYYFSVPGQESSNT